MRRAGLDVAQIYGTKFPQGRPGLESLPSERAFRCRSCGGRRGRAAGWAIQWRRVQLEPYTGRALR